MEPHYFIAIRLPAEIRAFLRRIQKKESQGFARFVHEEDLHLTLVFIGKCSDTQLKYLKERLRELVADWSPFRLQLSTTGIFGRADQPRIFWYGVKEEPKLHAYREIVFQEVKKLGFSLDERPFSPHITLARKWTSHHEYQKGKHTEEVEQSWEVEEIVIYETKVAELPKYHVVESFLFGD